MTPAAPATPATPATTTLPNHARVVIIGGGPIGCSLAYHLTRAGLMEWTPPFPQRHRCAKVGMGDVVLPKQGQLSCGATWHAAGLVGQLRAPVDPSGIRIKS